MAKKGFCRWSGDVVIDLVKLRTDCDNYAKSKNTTFSRIFESNDISSAFFKNAESSYHTYCTIISRPIVGDDLKRGITSIPRLKRICELCEFSSPSNYIVEEIPINEPKKSVKKESDNSEVVTLLEEIVGLLKEQNNMLSFMKNNTTAVNFKLDNIAKNTGDLGKVELEVLKAVRSTNDKIKK